MLVLEWLKPTCWPKDIGLHKPVLGLLSNELTPLELQ